MAHSGVILSCARRRRISPAVRRFLSWVIAGAHERSLAPLGMTKEAAASFVQSNALPAIKFFRHNFHHQWRNHQRIRILSCTSQIRAHFVSEGLIDPTHLNQARKINFDECHRPLPHVVSRTHTKDMRRGRPNNKPILREQHREIGRAIRFLRPTRARLRSRAREIFPDSGSVEETPGSIVSVFVKDRDTAFRHRIAEFLDQQRLIADKRQDPAAPGEIVIAFGKSPVIRSNS